MFVFMCVCGQIVNCFCGFKLVSEILLNKYNTYRQKIQNTFTIIIIIIIFCFSPPVCTILIMCDKTLNKIQKKIKKFNHIS